MVRKMYAGAAVATTLNGAISGAATTIVVTNGASYPDGSAGPFVICIDRGLGTEEKVLIATRTGNSMAVTTRGYDGTAAQAHGNLAPTEHVLDAATIDEANSFANLMTTRGDTIYRGATVPQRLVLGAGGLVYASNGTDPQWITPPIVFAAAIIEMSSTPAPLPATAEILTYSTVHRALMRWTGTQWVFADGVPTFLRDAFANAAIAGGTWATLTGIAGYLYLTAWSNANAVANSGASQKSQLNSPGMAGHRFRMNFRLPTSMATRTVRIGFHDSVDQNDATDGMYCEIVGLTASFKTAQGGTRTTNGTTAVLTANTFYTLHIIQLTTTTVRCIITADTGAVVLDVTNVANVPSGAQLFQAGFTVTRSDAAAVSSMLDTAAIAYGYAAV